MDLLQGIHEKLDLETSGEEAPVGAKDSPEHEKPVPWTYVWAAAAALLLMMNLLLVFIVSGQSTVRTKDVLSRIPGLGTSSPNVLANPKVPPALNSKALEARISRLRSQLSSQESELKKLLQSRSALEAENREVRQYNAGWQREYMHLAARVLPFFESKDGLSRFTVIEMVDVQAFDSQQPRRGFADLAGSFLTGEGNIAGVGSADFVGPLVEEAGMAQGDEALAPTPMGSTVSQTTDLADYSAPVEAETSLVGTTEAAMGFSVWRDDEQKGFLDIYNLPPPGEDRDAFLWVRASEYDPYVPVGYLPELEGGSGSFFYSVEEAQFTPTEILITAEDAFEPGAEPSSDVLLIGP
jgi:FtsZ-binding cell division protein ZapB